MGYRQETVGGILFIDAPCIIRIMCLEAKVMKIFECLYGSTHINCEIFKEIQGS